MAVLFTLNGTVAIGVRVRDAICERFGYTGFLTDGTTPQTKDDFFKAWIIKNIMEHVKAHESAKSAEAARILAAKDAETNIILT